MSPNICPGKLWVKAISIVLIFAFVVSSIPATYAMPESLSPELHTGNPFNSAEMRALMLCELIEARAREWEGKTIKEIYSDDLMLWQESFEPLFKNIAPRLSPDQTEIIIDIPGSNVRIRYYDPGPEKNSTFVPETNLVTTQTDVINDRVNRQIVRTTPLLPEKIPLEYTTGEIRDTKTVSDVIVEYLMRQGVQHIFGIPGNETHGLIDALRRRPELQYHPSVTEQSAGYMAETTARLSGGREEPMVPGALFTTLGPGATGAVSPMANARLDRVPTILIAAQAPTGPDRKVAHQYIDLKDLFKPITKFRGEIQTADEVAILALLDRAFRNAMTFRRGSVLLILPSNIAQMTVVPKKPVKRTQEQLMLPFADADMHQLPLPFKEKTDGPADETVLAAASAIRLAERPVMIIGNGVLRADAGETADLLRDFMEDHGIPATTTYMGKGAVPWSSSLTLPAMNSRHDTAAGFVREADLVVTIGYDPVECPAYFWHHGNRIMIINIDFTPTPTGGAFTPTLNLLGDIKASLAALTEALGDYRAPAELEKEVANIKSAHERIIERAMLNDRFPMHPVRVLTAVRHHVGYNNVIVYDVGNNKQTGGRFDLVEQPRTTVFFNSFAAMGGGIPAGIGAKLAHPDKRVAVICGDGGFFVSCNELKTAVENNVPLVVVVFDNTGWGMITKGQMLALGERNTYGTAFGFMDLVKISQGFGAGAAPVTSPNKLEPVLKEAFEEAERRSQPYVVVVPVQDEPGFPVTGQQSPATPIHPKKSYAIKHSYDHFMAQNQAIVSTLLNASKDTMLLRVPVEAVERIGKDTIAGFLSALEATPNGYVELYYMSGRGKVSDAWYRYYGLRKKTLPKEFTRTRANTITLFPSFKGDNISPATIRTRLGDMRLKPTDTVLSPISVQHDPAGLIRSTFFGLRMMYIARQQAGLGTVDEKFIRDTVGQYVELCESLGVDDPAIDAQDIMDLATGGINELIPALRKLINLLPITPFDVDMLEKIYEHGSKVVTAA